MTYSDSLDLFAWEPPGPASNPKPPTIEERFTSWAIANQHVLDELLRLARAQLAQGATFISTKALWESARVSLSAGKEGGYKLNNTFTAPASRWLLAQDQRLADVIETRTRRKP